MAASWLKRFVTDGEEPVIGPGTSSCAEAERATTNISVSIPGRMYENFAFIKIRTESEAVTLQGLTQFTDFSI